MFLNGLLYVSGSTRPAQADILDQPSSYVGLADLLEKLQLLHRRSLLLTITGDGAISFFFMCPTLFIRQGSLGLFWGMAPQKKILIVVENI